MPLFSSTQPSLRARILPRFPAQVLAGTGITITRSGGVYTFAASAYADIPLSALSNINSGVIIGRDAVGLGPPQELTVAGGLGVTGAGGLELTANQRLRGITVPLTSLSTGIKQDVVIPVSCTIRGVTLLADQTGSVVVDIWKDTYANFPPTVADTICAAAKPTISAAIKSTDTVLTGWTTNITAGDVLRFNIDSVATITRLSINITAETL